MSLRIMRQQGVISHEDFNTKTKLIDLQKIREAITDGEEHMIEIRLGLIKPKN